MARRSRCSPKRIVTVLNHVSKEDLNSLAEVGFSGVMKVKITRISEEFLMWAVDRYEVSSRSFILDGNRRLRLTEDDVARVYGLPRGPNHLDVEKYPNSLLKELGLELNIGDDRSGKDNVELLVLKKRLTEESDICKRRKLLILYIMGGLLCPTSHPVANLGYLPLLTDAALPDFKHYNWCKHVIDHFNNGMVASKKNKYISADVHLLLVSICEQLGSPGKTPLTTAPSCKNWDNSTVQKKLDKFKSQRSLVSATQFKRQPKKLRFDPLPNHHADVENLDMDMVTHVKRKPKKPRFDPLPNHHAVFPGTTLDVEDLDMDMAYTLKSWYEITRATCERHIATLDNHIARLIDENRKEEEHGNDKTGEHEGERLFDENIIVKDEDEYIEQEEQQMDEFRQTTDADLELSNTLLSIKGPYNVNGHDYVRKSSGKRKLIS
ncbi:hypothetical protein LINPERPRIM_LOCUS39863 [Linum perenne]